MQVSSSLSVLNIPIARGWAVASKLQTTTSQTIVQHCEDTWHSSTVYILLFFNLYFTDTNSFF